MRSATLPLSPVIFLFFGCPTGVGEDAGPRAPVCGEDGVFEGDLHGSVAQPERKHFIEDECTTITGDLELFPETPPLPLLRTIQGELIADGSGDAGSDWSCCLEQLPTLEVAEKGVVFFGPSLTYAGLPELITTLQVTVRDTSVDSINFNSIESLGRPGSDEECESVFLPSGCHFGGIRFSGNAQFEQLFMDSVDALSGFLLVRENPSLHVSSWERFLEVLDEENTQVSICGNREQEPCED